MAIDITIIALENILANLFVRTKLIGVYEMTIIEKIKPVFHKKLKNAIRSLLVNRKTSTGEKNSNASKKYRSELITLKTG